MHSVWRDPRGDFADDPLARHHAEHHHQLMRDQAMRGRLADVPRTFDEQALRCLDLGEVFPSALSFPSSRVDRGEVGLGTDPCHATHGPEHVRQQRNRCADHVLDVLGDLDCPADCVSHSVDNCRRVVTVTTDPTAGGSPGVP